MAEEVEAPIRAEFLPAWMRQPDPGQRRPRPELSGQQDAVSTEWADPPAPEEHGEVDARLLPGWMVAMTLAVPMPPSKVLAQVEVEHLDGPAPEQVDAQASDEPAEVDVQLQPRWMRAGLERGPQPGAQTQAGPGPAELNEREDPTAW